MSQNELAEAADVSQNTVFKIERGLTKASRSLPAIAKALGQTVEALLSDDEPEAPAISPAKARLLRKVEGADELTIPEIEKVVDAIINAETLKAEALKAKPH
ncbi:MAG: helix-turn-helix transcriptional regulator [Thiothrix sp.]|nr:helix-turn-helix transcriptional regulator [Thiothrix sp.]